jgi:hypothetical protein
MADHFAGAGKVIEAGKEAEKSDNLQQIISRICTKWSAWVQVLKDRWLCNNYNIYNSVIRLSNSCYICNI